jgi:hypothetical protein
VWAEALQERLQKGAHGLHVSVGEEGAQEGHNLPVPRIIVALRETERIGVEVPIPILEQQPVERRL